MPLLGATWAKWGNRLAEYLEGSDDDGGPLELVPVAGGDPVPFTHDEREEELETLEDDGLGNEFLHVYTRSELVMGAKYTYDSDSWTVELHTHDRAGSTTGWPFGYRLRRHAH